MRIRALRRTERPLLDQATLANVNWTGESRLTAGGIATTPELARYTRLDRSRGDLALVAERGRDPIGVVWLIHPRPADPGYGFVRDDVPELSVSVWQGHRGRGVGGALLRAVIREARGRGLPGISLSVDSGNPARRLYQRHGFVDVPDAAEGTMLLDLVPDPPHPVEQSRDERPLP